MQEVLHSRADLDWLPEPGGFTTTFSIDGREYGISVQIEQHQDLSFLRVDFHFKSEQGPQHTRTGFSTDQFKVVGIVANGVKERFPTEDGYYFIAKRGVNPEGYESRVKLYRRVVDRLRVELSLFSFAKDTPTETVFMLARNREALDIMKS
jgi:hypothetical protein